jgi:hypothetical protein
MVAVLSVGGPGPRLPTGWDFALPVYIVLSLVLIRFAVRVRITPWTLVGSVAAGIMWDWASHAWGLVPALALSVLLALMAGAVLRRIATGGRGR